MNTFIEHFIEAKEIEWDMFRTTSSPLGTRSIYEQCINQFSPWRIASRVFLIYGPFIYNLPKALPLSLQFGFLMFRLPHPFMNMIGNKRQEKILVIRINL